MASRRLPLQVAFLALSVAALACGDPPPASSPAQVARPAAAPRGPESAASQGPASQGPASQGAATASPTPGPSRARDGALPTSERFVAERTLDGRVVFLETGLGGRLAALADDGGVVLPHRFEDGRWAALPLPARWRSPVDASSLGIFFGRDHRPRLMGHRTEGAERRMVYLRYKDGRWQDQRVELGALGGDTSVLFGVLGDADPEVVCRVGSICLLKSRQGWKEVKNTLPETAVVRTQRGEGWALTAEGLLVARDGVFTRVGPAAPWTSEATGFWVADGGAVTVAEPGADALHVLDGPDAAWRTERSPVVAPRDVAGPPGDRWIAGDGGLAHEEGGAFARVGDAAWKLARVIPTERGVVAGGGAGVVVARPVE